jgi:multiple sugar transport system substrate-binding protein
MKKVLSCVLAITIALSFSLVGCAKKAPAGPVQIDFWYGLGGKLGQDMETIIKDFNDSQTGVVVTGVQQARYEETEQQVLTAVAAGSVPACALVRSQVLSNYAQKNVAADLDPYIAADKNFNKSDLIPAFLSYCTPINGKVIALPAYGTTQVMYYRKDAFQKAGIDPDQALQTWQSLAAAAKKMTVYGPDGTPTFYGWDIMWGAENMQDIAYDNGAQHLSADGKKALLNTPAWVDSWEQVRKWLNEDKIFGFHHGGTGWEYWYQTIDDVMQNRAAGYVGSSGDQGDLDFNIVAAHIQPGWEGGGRHPYADSLNVVILNKASKAQKDAAWKWLDFLTSPDETAKFSVLTGYIPCRSSAENTTIFKNYSKDHPQALVPLRQAKIARKTFIDFTGGKIDQAILDAVDEVEIENWPAQKALDQANKIAQAALDEYWADNPDAVYTP